MLSNVIKSFVREHAAIIRSHGVWTRSRKYNSHYAYNTTTMNHTFWRYSLIQLINVSGGSSILYRRPLFAWLETMNSYNQGTNKLQPSCVKFQRQGHKKVCKKVGLEKSISNIYVKFTVKLVMRIECLCFRDSSLANQNRNRKQKEIRTMNCI